jgi:5'-nucleotidase
VPFIEAHGSEESPTRCQTRCQPPTRCCDRTKKHQVRCGGADGTRTHDTLLEQQWCNQAAPKVLQVSASVSYTWSAGAPPCARVDPATIRFGGVAVDPAGSYRVTVNSFLADGGDGFAVLKDGTDRLGGAVDLDAFATYLSAVSPLAPPPLGRITVTP